MSLPQLLQGGVAGGVQTEGREELLGLGTCSVSDVSVGGGDGGSDGGDGHLIPPELTRDSLTSSWDSLFIYSPINTIKAEIVIRKLSLPVSPHHGVCDEVA